MQLDTRASSTDAFSEILEGQSPDHQVVLRSAIDLSPRVQFDATLRYVDELPAIGIPSYVEMDLRLGWEPLKGLELALVGQNLLHERHAEFPTAAGQANLPVQMTEIERGFYGLVRWRF